MILCTNYGLIVYEYFLDFVKKEKEECKDNQEREMLSNVKYKISVLPDEQVLDCVVLDPMRPKDSQLLVCCASGAYVILRRSANSF